MFAQHTHTETHTHPTDRPVVIHANRPQRYMPSTQDGTTPQQSLDYLGCLPQTFQSDAFACRAYPCSEYLNSNVPLSLCVYPDVSLLTVSIPMHFCSLCLHPDTSLLTVSIPIHPCSLSPSRYIPAHCLHPDTSLFTVSIQIHPCSLCLCSDISLLTVSLSRCIPVHCVSILMYPCSMCLSLLTVSLS